MFDKRLLWTGGALAATVIISLFLANIPALGTAGEEGPIIDDTAGIGAYVPRDLSPDGESKPEYAYILGEYEGKIAVFVPGKREPEIIFEILVKFLPDYDRAQMKSGIPVKDYEALSKIIEDYIS